MKSLIHAPQHPIRSTVSLPSKLRHVVKVLSFGVLATALICAAAYVFPKHVRAQSDEIQIFVPLVANSGPTASADPSDPTTPVTEGRLVFAAYEFLNTLVTSDIVTMNPDGTDRVQITNAADGTIHESPTWSPDGTRIAFSHQNRQTGTERGIYVIDADGSNRVRLTNSDGQGEDYAPSWSPDGTRIAYYTTNFNIPQIMIVNSDGTNLQQITDFQTSQNPQWSPDGTKIVFESNRYELGNARKEIYVMNPDGSDATRLTFNPTTDDGDPRWSPDGTKIVFWSLRGNVGGLYVMNADGSNLQQVPNMSQSIVSWSPDGGKFVFGAQLGSGSNFEIFTINTDGSGMEQVTDTADLIELSPDWRP